MVENDTPKEESATYLKLNVTDKYNCLNFWKKNKKNFDRFGKMALEFQIPPATNVDSERCFSKSSENISKKRIGSYLKPVDIYCV